MAPIKIEVHLQSRHTDNMLLTIQILHPYRLSTSSIRHFSNDFSFSHVKDSLLNRHSLNFLEYYFFFLIFYNRRMLISLVFSFKYKLFRVRFDVV